MKPYFVVVLMSFTGCTCHTIEPGNKGVLVSWGKLQQPALDPSFNFVWIGSDIYDVSTRAHKEAMDAECFSSDMQDLKLKISVIYRIPDAQVLRVFRDFSGKPFDVIVAPRAQEALKEVTAVRSAEHIVKDREKVKTEALVALRAKVGDVLVVDDLIIENIDLSKELGKAIEQKMVQEQEAAKAKFTKQKAEIDAETAVAKAKGEADSALLKAEADAKAIKVRGQALRENPAVVQLQLVEKWNGVSPTIVAGGASGTSLLLPAASTAGNNK